MYPQSALRGAEPILSYEAKSPFVLLDKSLFVSLATEMTIKLKTVLKDRCTFLVFTNRVTEPYSVQ